MNTLTTNTLALMTSTALLLAGCGGSGAGGSADTGLGPTPYVVDKYAAQLDSDAREDFQTVQIDVNGRSFISANAESLQYVLDPNAVPTGVHSGEADIAWRDPQGKAHASTSPLRSYRGFHSGVYVIHPIAAAKPGTSANQASPWYNPTGAAQLPTGGKATYQGHALNIHSADSAAFTYHVDFANKTGSGLVAGNAQHASLTLHEARLEAFNDNGLSGYRFDGSATATGLPQPHAYQLILSGDRAQEITGYAKYLKDGSTYELGLHGTRGDITP